MPLEMFAGVSVADFEAGRAWYVRLFGAQPSFVAHDTEVVWELADHRSVYVVLDPVHAGHAKLSLFVEDLESVVDAIAERGIEPTGRESYGNGVTKVLFHDPEGNEVGYGGYDAGADRGVQ